MLQGSEIFAGSLKSAPLGSLLLPRTQFEVPFLIGGTAEARIALCLGENYPFQGFECANGDDWRGLIIPQVLLEVDPGSAFSPQEDRTPAGAIVRENDRLSFAAASSHRLGGMRPTLIAFETGLSPCEQGHSVGFRKWQVALGEGLSKRVLRTINLAAPTAS